MDLIVLLHVIDIVEMNETVAVKIHRLTLIGLVQFIHVRRQRGCDKSLRNQVIVVLKATWYTSEEEREWAWSVLPVEQAHNILLVRVWQRRYDDVAVVEIGMADTEVIEG